MRDDFTQPTKDLLAERVGFRCSNPNCRQPTSGPQADPLGTVNLGVAAHITAAAPGGKRYNLDLTPQERSAPANGIWLCQTDAKLVDNDDVRFTVEVLRTWKADAEAEAARALGHRLQRFPQRSDVFARIERLMPALIAEMRNDISGSPLGRLFILLSTDWMYCGSLEPEFVYYYECHTELVEKVRILENERLVVEVQAIRPVMRFRFTEEFADYLGAP